MSENLSESDEFDFGKWLSSVQGETVHVTSPWRHQLGPQASKLFTSPIPSSEQDTYCKDCDGYYRPVKTDSEEVVGHCPACGRRPGLAEMGDTRG